MSIVLLVYEAVLACQWLCSRVRRAFCNQLLYILNKLHSYDKYNAPMCLCRVEVSVVLRSCLDQVQCERIKRARRCLLLVGCG